MKLSIILCDFVLNQTGRYSRVFSSCFPNGADRNFMTPAGEFPRIRNCPGGFGQLTADTAP